MREALSRVALLWMFSGCLGWASGPPIPVSILERQSDIILVATVQAVAGEPAGVVRAQIQPVEVLKGQMPSSPVAVHFLPSLLMRQIRETPSAASQGRTGLWFLKRGENGDYQVIPTVGEDGYTWQSDAFLPLPSGWSFAATGTIGQKLLSAVVEQYKSVPNPSFLDESRLLVSVDKADRAEALAASLQLMLSPILSERVIGFASAIRIGSDDAIVRLAQEIGTLRSHQTFDRITYALYPIYQPNGASSVEPLSRLVKLRSDVRGLDAAVQKALQRIGTKEVLPLMVELLDSRDSQAQLGACWFLAFYAHRAGADGSPNRTGDGKYPFASEETRRYMPVQDSEIPTEVYVSFWKSWWAQNGVKFSFPAAQGQ